MEILSTGEKIKRIRIYHGVTLKELCGDKVSVSKMSCIENGKIKADKDILEYVSKKLNIDYDYLVSDVKEQLISNLEFIKKNAIEEKEDALKNNINYALEYSYEDLAFEFTHILFNYYIEKGKVENIHSIISQYYDLYQKNNSLDNTITYYIDMAEFFYSTEEYSEAINYYSRIKPLLKEKEELDENVYSYICYKEGMSYLNSDNLDKAYDSLKEAINYIDSIKDDNKKGDLYQAFARINILLDNEEKETYIKLSYSYKEGNKMALAIAKGENGKCFFAIKEQERGLREIKEGIELFPKESKIEYVKFLNNCVKTLYDNEEYEYAFEIIDIALNYAIELDDIVQIEKAYYLKGMILQKHEMYTQAEIYMNLSLDSLLKFANNEQKYERYLDMAEMYYKLGETRESLKYFGLAIKIKEFN
ncbi:helix-turn-helix domain-containing protein [Caproiciproducens sp. MSJ-32]|uniref:helix-turn-helix domain-containing protein n=1 Tax=Caproiciproducens sp. MSJ-32 TaxID=2841527 RepID=UPI001C0FC082|nr:helix-turn-helix transcriptional regulator [Caproiciproducens sp. MSJ-32]MBU5455310.1 helix-turn-helix domain-containing protein [Caproiciproducens sp. MSJ-32]